MKCWVGQCCGGAEKTYKRECGSEDPIPQINQEGGCGDVSGGGADIPLPALTRCTRFNHAVHLSRTWARTHVRKMTALNAQFAGVRYRCKCMNMVLMEHWIHG